MSFGLYVHIPYCLQICTYCDFVKFESSALPPKGDYVRLLQTEIESRSQAWLSGRKVTSVYFGGGTPSLFSAKELRPILDSFQLNGLDLSSVTEMTLEINPGTITAESLAEYQEIGFNRFSVGVQTFDPQTLALTGRKHSVEDSVRTLELLHQSGAHFTLDLIFAMPNQTEAMVLADADQALSFEPKHVSLYCLTVPERHPLNANRPTDSEQAVLFGALAHRLEKAGLMRYEVSNFSVPGKESQHNQLYWQNQPYWGIGIGAHSYRPRGFEGEISSRDPSTSQANRNPWGTRFWNPSAIAGWKRELRAARDRDFFYAIEPSRLEVLKPWQALTDFCHTSLRAKTGLNIGTLESTFGPEAAQSVERIAQALTRSGLLESSSPQLYSMTESAIPIADQVFSELTFLASDSLTFLEDDPY